MKRKNKYKYIILTFIVILILIGIYIFIKDKNDQTNKLSSDVSETEVIKTDILNTLSSSGYIETGLEENKQLHATYYFEDIYFEENQYIKAGENILKYTNGEYMVAPYNCVITKKSLPNAQEICTDQHYITIQSTDTLNMTLSIEEDELNTIHNGQEAQIEIKSLDNKVITGYVINISNSATYSSSGSTFDVTVEFQNDGNILLGMSAKCSIILEKVEDVIAVANEAIINQNNKNYVKVKNDNGDIENVEVEIGISNDAYSEVKSGLSEGDIALIEENNSQKNQNNRFNSQRMEGGKQMEQKNNGDFPEMNQGEMPQIPSKMDNSNK